MTRGASSVALACAALATTAARAARADDPIALTWIAPPGCPTGDDVLRRVMAAEVPPRPAGALPVRARGVVRGSDSQGWLVVLTFQEPTSIEARSFEAARCDTLAAAAAHSLRLALAVAPATPVARAVVPPRVPELRVRPVARVDVGLALGRLPALTASTRLSLGVVFSRWRVEAGVGGWPVGQTALVARESFVLRAWDVGVRLCRTIGSDRWELRPCVGLDVGFVSVAPDNAQLLATDSFWVGASVGLHGTWWFASAVGAFLGASAGLNAAPVSFGFREEAPTAERTLDAQSLVYASVAGGMELRL